MLVKSTKNWHIRVNVYLLVSPISSLQQSVKRARLGSVRYTYKSSNVTNVNVTPQFPWDSWWNLHHIVVVFILLDLSLEIRPPLQPLHRDFDQLTLDSYAKVGYFNSGPLWSNIFKSGLRDVQYYVNLQLLVQPCWTQSSGWGWAAFIRNGAKNIPFLSNATHAQPQLLNWFP